MIKKVTVTNHLGESLTIELANPESSGFAIYSIRGLGPVTANVNVTNFSLSDGAVFNSARLPTREIVISMYFWWGLLETIEQIRHKSYRYFPIKKQISLVIETDERKVAIDGIVEKNEPDIFNQMEAAEITILCPDPYFYGVDVNNEYVYDKVTYDGYTFQFPFSNNSLTDKLLTFAQGTQSANGSLMYPGDAETGFTATIHFFEAVDDSKFTLSNETTGKSMSINLNKVSNKLGSDIKNGDELIISTMAGYKTVSVRRNNVLTNVLTYLDMKDANFDWLTIVPGENRINYSSRSASKIRVTVRYPVLYEGV